jgi:predicted nuclease of predicted toxin-antitoxin system
VTHLLTDEHVPSVFVTTLRSKGHDVRRAIEELSEGTDDYELLSYCAENGAILLTHDKKDFAGETETTVDHDGIVIYTDANFLRDRPEEAVRTLERALDTTLPPSDGTKSSGSTSGGNDGVR